MQIDTTTLSDLEVFRSADGSSGIFDIVDRTATSRGRAALRRAFECPASDIRPIRRTQDAVRFFQAHPRVLAADEQAVRAVDRYLKSNIVLNATTSLGRRAEYLWMAVGYRDLLRELQTGVRATTALFDRVASLCTALVELNPPAIVSEVVQDLTKISRAVLHAGTASILFRADTALRFELRTEIEEALNRLGDLDAWNAMASATTSLGWVLPELVESSTFLLEAEELFHPFVEKPIPNPARLSGGEPMVFLTGPNMAGKTTYIRAIALVVLLGQVGMGVPASRARLTPVDALFTSLNPVDNLKAGLSFFLAEVMRVKAAARILADGRRALVLFDEVFKGTNVRDALEASAEVILGFSKARRSGFVFSSHLTELVEVLRTSPSIRFCYFDGDIVRGSPHYSYQLREGVSDKRFGLLLLRQAEIPELLARIGA
ncbi:MAG: hypothetical protein ABI877_05865 [Gemmatimonadaceae bacterium]